VAHAIVFFYFFRFWLGRWVTVVAESCALLVCDQSRKCIQAAYLGSDIGEEA
jgi:hypothetical protein